MLRPDVVVVGGSGPSLPLVDLRRVPRNAFVVRVNNFFFEDRYYLGRRVDCAYFSSDPRALRFYAATLDRVIRRDIYAVESAASHNSHARRCRLSVPVRMFEVRNPEAADLVERHRSQSGVLPSSGVMAVLFAAEIGASRVLLAGIDFYAGEQKYAFEPPPRLARILEPNRSAIGYDEQLHSRDLDVALVRLLLDQGLEVYLTAPQPPEMAAVLPLELAPELPAGERRDGEIEEKREFVRDWEARSGMWTIGTLAALRRARAFSRAVRRTNLPNKTR